MAGIQFTQIYIKLLKKPYDKNYISQTSLESYTMFVKNIYEIRNECMEYTNKTKKQQKKKAQRAQVDSAELPKDAPADVQNAAETESQTQEEQETAPAKKRTVRRTRKAKNA